MSRLMSCSETEEAVVAQTKDMTRRLGWKFVKPGDRLTLCRKVMGRSKKCGGCAGYGGGIRGEGSDLEWVPCTACSGAGRLVDPLVRLADVEVTAVRREKLWDITDEDIAREGVPVDGRFEDVYVDTGKPTTTAWVTWFCEAMGCRPDTEVTVIEWRYLTPKAAGE